MAIRIYNTLTRHDEELKPLVPGRIGMYVCGPTVYSDCHIGHLMGPVHFDAVARWLKARGHAVRFINNITDIDDKIIDKAQATGESWQAITRRYTAQYFDLLTALGVETITAFPRCSEHIPGMVAFIRELEQKGVAYRAGDGIYFDVAAYPDYGRLSGRKVEDMLAGARIERGSDLRHSADFCLWKLAKPHEPSWDSPWGAGRPGWHIECSVMGECLLGGAFDIHGGGDDLKFPHHENEIAQSRANGRDFARIWMHNGLVQYQGVKVAKSDPRNKDPEFAAQFLAKNLMATWGGDTIRFLFLSGHYRRPVDFAPEHIAEKQKALGRIREQLGSLLAEPSFPGFDEVLERRVSAEAAQARARFCEAMDDDFNSGRAVAELFKLLDHAKRMEPSTQTETLRMVRDLGQVIGLFPLRVKPEFNPPRIYERTQKDLVAVSEHNVAIQGCIPMPYANMTAKQTLPDAVITERIADRAAAKAAKDFATADAIRKELAAAGIGLKDGKDGTTWQRILPS